MNYLILLFNVSLQEPHTISIALISYTTKYTSLFFGIYLYILEFDSISKILSIESMYNFNNITYSLIYTLILMI